MEELQIMLKSRQEQLTKLNEYIARFDNEVIPSMEWVADIFASSSRHHKAIEHQFVDPMKEIRKGLVRRKGEVEVHIAEIRSTMKLKPDESGVY